MFRKFDELPEKQKKILGAIGITFVLGTWVLVPLVATIWGYSSIDVAFALTAVYVVIWFMHKGYKRYYRKKSEE